MQIDDNEYVIGSLGDWINRILNNLSAFTDVLNYRRQSYVVRYPTSFIDYDCNLYQHLQG